MSTSEEIRDWRGLVAKAAAVGPPALGKLPEPKVEASPMKEESSGQGLPGIIPAGEPEHPTSGPFGGVMPGLVEGRSYSGLGNPLAPLVVELGGQLGKYRNSLTAAEPLSGQNWYRHPWVLGPAAGLAGGAGLMALYNMLTNRRRRKEASAGSFATDLANAVAQYHR
jgi:hypothetical protein